MRWLKNLIFPNVCNRCKEPEENYLCNLCISGLELKNVRSWEPFAHLFESKVPFLYANRTHYRKLIIAFTVVQLNRLKWTYGRVHSEPELIYLKKYLEKNTKLNGHKTLYLIHRENDPILKEAMRKDSFVLII